VFSCLSFELTFEDIKTSSDTVCDETKVHVKKTTSKLTTRLERNYFDAKNIWFGAIFWQILS
jgi:hypothetical protein